MSVLTNRRGAGEFITRTIPEAVSIYEVMKKLTKEVFPRYSRVTYKSYSNGREIWVSVSYPADTREEINEQIKKFQILKKKWVELTGLNKYPGYFTEGEYILRGILAADVYYSELLTEKDRRKLEAAQ